MKKTTLLCILDGFGLNPKTEGNAVALADTPTFDRIWETCPKTTLTTHGERVGLPEGQMGNSEVGHLNIGAGRVVDQWLLRISKDLRNGTIVQNKSFKGFIDSSANCNRIHLIGMFSDGGVHSHSEHLILLVKLLCKLYQGEIVLHLITDGRDTAPQAAFQQISDLEKTLEHDTNLKRVTIATVCGRFFAMDRDKRWERTNKFYQALLECEGERSGKASDWVKRSYDSGINDEFIEPAIVNERPISADDGVIFWNFRADRMRQIVDALCIEGFTGFARKIPILEKQKVLCFTNYDSKFGLHYVYEPIEIKNFLGEAVANLGLSQLRVAETEKYAHVTYFLNGGSEVQLKGEERVLIPSPRDVKTYDLKPEMSALQVKEAVIKGINDRNFDLIVVNFANCDMVGHTGVLEAAIKAVETVDSCLGEILENLEKTGGNALIIADHGNAEQLINYQDGTPHTAHTTYPVPAVIFGLPTAIPMRQGGALCDVAPTTLKLMGIDKPIEMQGEPLF